MFRHQGRTRTFKHNLRLAALLSFIAGLVNITGVLRLNVLTTNVTGHFAFFAEELVQKNYSVALSFLFFIFSFLIGSFVSSFITEYYVKKGASAAHKYSMVIEILMLLGAGFGGSYCYGNSSCSITLAGVLLFSMGIQNSLVTQISESTVRTTHLTGLFTDLGIELSQLFFYKRKEQREKLFKSIKIRMAIIACFFLGCVIGGFMFSFFELRTLLIASVLLFVALTYDVILYKYYRFIRRAR